MIKNKKIHFIIIQILFLVSCNKEEVKSSSNLSIGKDYKGGKIAYIFGPKDKGYIEGEIHGIIAASEDLSLQYNWGLLSGKYASVEQTLSDIGSGRNNTELIVQRYGNGKYAAKACYDLILEGYEDWFLPSKEELQILCANKKIIGGFKEGSNCSYWSSSQGNYYAYGWYNGFCSCYQQELEKVNEEFVRPVRYF